MAAVNLRKRSHSSTDPDDSPFETPTKKAMRHFAEGPPPLAKLRKRWFASQINWTLSDEVKENEVKASRRLDISPLQTARSPVAMQGESSKKVSPEPASSYKPFLSVASFYSKEKRYLTPLERKELNEIRALGEWNRGENLPAASKMENRSRNTNSKPTKHTTSSKRGKTISKTMKNVKGDGASGKPHAEKENVSCLIKKKMDSPFRVLSLTVKPALKLQLGAAFFSVGKKSHSKKTVVDTKSLQVLPKSPQGNNQPELAINENSNTAERNATLEVPRSVPAPQKEENGNRKDSPSCVNEETGSACEGETLPQKSGSRSSPFCDFKSPGAGNAEGGDVEEIGSSAAEELDDCVVVSSQPPPKVNERAPSNAVYPIFNAAPTSKKRMQAALDELTSPFGSSPPTKPSHTFQKSKKPKELCKRSWDQMIIDAGQKHFGAVVCKSCGMIYTAASPEDEAQHIQHHERFLEGLRYVGWKKERVVAEFWDGKIVLILPNDPKYAVKKAEDMREIVDNELGFKQVSLSCPDKSKIYLFVSNEKMIVGCLVAESIKQAFRVLSEPGAPMSPSKDALQHQRAWRCSTEPEPAVCGISRIWVFSLRRRKGIARRMVDVVRSTFMYGCYLSTNEIAFSDPTPDGKLFAMRYCQTPNFLVYNFIYNN
ncbi:N-acetyltransferase ESCO2 isoform X2 [Cuculus canorus]|uniref:N-acetyltransferase ESCO2 isoform X2 n=1 Tax=Cuculus canorus TaxID=55661 RepID=UPI0023AB0F5C|nr:N-acetyltransferase ESCO2 isoform X2 [Cuculus canorus]